MREAVMRRIHHIAGCVFRANGAWGIGASCLSLAVASQVFSGGISIEQAIREACTNSDSVKMMRETLVKSGEMVREKRSNAFPKLSASAYTAKSRGSFVGAGGASGGGGAREAAASAEEGAYETVPGFSFAPLDTPPPYVTWPALQAMFSDFSKPQHTTAYGCGMSITQPIYTFGKIGAAIKVARMFDKSARYSYKRNLQTLQFTALDAFIGAVMTEKIVREAERSFERHKELNEFLERNFQLGSGSKGLVLSTRADVISLRSSVLSAKQAASMSRMTLNFIMGRPLTDSSALDTVALPDGLLDTPPPAYDSAVQYAANARMDLKSLDFLAESYKGGAKIFRSMYMPSIVGTGSVGYSKYKSESSVFEMDGTANWSVGIGVQWSLFDGFENSAKAAQFMSDARKLEIIRGTVAKGLEIEIKNAVMECRIADDDCIAAGEKLGAARESYDLTNSDFKQGSGQLSDLQRVEAQLFSAELGVTNARYRKIRSRAALRVAMGRDIANMEER